MKSPMMVAGLTFLLTVPMLSSEGLPKPRPALDAPSSTNAMGTNSPEPGVALVRVGDPAPDISYTDLDGRWSRLHDLLGQGPVLLVFGADEAALRSLQREREALIGLGVVPVAIADLRSGAVRSMAQRLGLTFPVYPDPRGIAASQFNSLDGNTLHPVPAWFVVDRSGRVRGLGRGALPSRWAEASAGALGLPAPDAPRQAKSR